MSPELALDRTDFESRAISPLRELGAYEALWDKPETTFKTLSEKFAARPDAVPSDFVSPTKAREYAEFVHSGRLEVSINWSATSQAAPLPLTACENIVAARGRSGGVRKVRG